jgi:hypothetical protein
METVNLNISQAQHNKLISGGTVRLKNEDIDSGSVRVSLGSRNYNKLMNAQHKGSGVQIQLTQEELKQVGGAGFMKDARKFANKAGRNVKRATDVGEDVTRKLDVTMRKTANTLNKIDGVMDEYDYLRYAPVIGDAYGAVHDGVSAGAEGATQARKVTLKARKVAEDVNDFAQAPSWEKAQNMASKHLPTAEQVDQMNATTGSGLFTDAINRRVKDGRGAKGGRGLVMSRGGGLVMSRGGSSVNRSGPEYHTQEWDTHLKPDHGSFHGALDNESFSASQFGKCKHCGR